jgi:L-ascorbate metabolism protein UlaG (beta-lactamase superfamily)
VWEVEQQGQTMRILVDPLVVGNLDFGAPWLFDGAKRSPEVRALGVDDLLALDPGLLLITQSLDDHCHARTLTQLSARAPELPVVTTPNARPVLASLPTPFRRVTYLEPGQSAAVGGARLRLRVVATAGPVLGPPWQRPENGYALVAGGHGLLYYEPHCVYDESSFFLPDPDEHDKGQRRQRLQADVVITPVVKQLLPANFTLVSGQEDAVRLASLLRARYVVPMSNGDVDAGGLLAAVISKQGTTESFEAKLTAALPGQVQVLQPTPGVPLQLQLLQNQ